MALHLIPLRQGELTILADQQVPRIHQLSSPSCNAEITGMSGCCVLEWLKGREWGGEVTKKRQTDGHMDIDRNTGSGGPRS